MSEISPQVLLSGLQIHRMPRPSRRATESARRRLLRVLVVVTLALFIAHPCYGKNAARQRVSGKVTDALGRPLADASLRLEARTGQLVGATTSSAKGSFSFAAVRPGTYAAIARKPGFREAVTIVIVSAAKSATITLAMQSETVLSLTVTAHRTPQPRSRVSSSGATVYHFNRKAIASLPEGQNSTFNQVLLQAPGMMQDSTGQALPREMDDALQYRIDGVMIPNVQLLDLGQLSSRFADSISVLSGALPAEYGYRTGSVVDILTKSGDIAPGGRLEFYGGQRETTEPSIEYGGTAGKLSYFGTGYFIHTNRGMNPPTPGPVPINDFSNQGGAFGYLSYLLNADTSLRIIGLSFVHDFGWPTQPWQPQIYDLQGVPVYPSQNVSDTEFEQTQLGIISLKGAVGPEFDYRVSLFTQYSALTFHPDVPGDLIYEGLASRVFRSSFLNGSQADATYRFSHAHTFRFGYYFDVEAAEADDDATTFPANASGQQTSDVPIQIVDNHNLLQAMYGLYAQDTWRPLPRLIVNYGVRWDQLVGFISSSQASPRLSVAYNLFPEWTTLHAGAAIYFVPPPTEFIDVTDLQKFANTTAAPEIPLNTPPKAMTDYFFNTGLRQRVFTGMTLGIDAYFSLQRNTLDEGQFGSSLISAPINYRHGRVYGTNLTAAYNAGGHLSTYFNFGYTVAQVNDVVSGQFNFTTAEFNYIANHYIFIDQGQTFTASGGFDYRWRGFTLSANSIFGSGLRRGFANTGEMPPYLQINGSIRSSFTVPGVGQLEGRVSVINLFDRIYEFHNGTGIGVGNVPQYMARRAVYAGVSVPLP